MSSQAVLEQHLLKVKESGLMLVEDDGELVLLSCKNGEPHKYEKIAIPDNRTGQRQLSRTVGQLVMQMMKDARR